ncbi:hypothetical protein ACN38_g13148, partial [Penicillium nordicum]
ILNW